MIDEFVNWSLPQRGETQQHGVIAERFRDFCFGRGLPGFATYAGDLYGRMGFDFFRSKLEHRFEQIEFRIANCELSGVDAYGNPAGAGRKIVACERTLVTFIELAVFGQRKRVRGNDESFAQFVADMHQNFPS